MPTTTVSKTVTETETGDEQVQYRTTVPKQLAEAFDMAGARIEWQTISKSALRIDIQDDE